RGDAAHRDRKDSASGTANQVRSPRGLMETTMTDSATRMPPLDASLTPRPIAAGVQIGHVDLKVADLDRALAFYCGVLGFELMSRREGAAFVSAGGYHHHIGLNTWESKG